MMLKMSRMMRYPFSLFRTSDPYYVLGVEKRAEFTDIKKKFYEYANIYHPDKNPSPEASNEFMLIKEAFEQIKYERGLSIAQNIEKSQSQFQSEYHSVRPHASQYNQRNEEAHPNFSSTTDYKMYQQKVPDGEEYDKFRQSFATIDNINDIKIKVEKGEVKDNMDRLGLEAFRVNIQAISNASTAPKVIFAVCAALLVIFLNSQLNLSEDQKHLETAGLLKKQQGNFVRANDGYSQEEVNTIRKDVDYMKFKRQKVNRENDLKFLSKSEKVFTPEQAPGKVL